MNYGKIYPRRNLYSKGFYKFIQNHIPFKFARCVFALVWIILCLPFGIIQAIWDDIVKDLSDNIYDVLEDAWDWNKEGENYEV